MLTAPIALEYEITAADCSAALAASSLSADEVMDLVVQVLEVTGPLVHVVIAAR